MTCKCEWVCGSVGVCVGVYVCGCMCVGVCRYVYRLWWNVLGLAI